MPHAGEEDADRFWVLVLSETAKEVVDGQPHPPRSGRFFEVEDAFLDGEVGVWGDHVDRVLPDLHAVLDLYHRHRGAPLEDLGQKAPVFGVHVGDHHEPCADIGGRVLEEGLKGLKPPGRCADAGDDEGRHFCDLFRCNGFSWSCFCWIYLSFRHTTVALIPPVGMWVHLCTRH